MAITGPIGILEVPSVMGSDGLSKEGITLEEAIKEDFGEAGLARFRNHEVYVDVPHNTGFKLEFDREGQLKKYGDSFEDPKDIIGLIYQISMHKIDEIGAQNVNTRLERHSGLTTYSITLDLNPADEQKRYLKMFFEYN